MTTASASIDRYFHLASQRGAEAYVAQFVPDAHVEDEGVDHHGVDAIRIWHSEVPSVAYAVREVRDDGGTCVAVAEISGDFPGSPVELAFRFEFAGDGRIESLAIRT